MEGAGLVPGATYEFDYRVQQSDGADRLALADHDEFPRVLATCRMVGLMELAAARLMRQSLQADCFSVGVGLEIRHVAPTPIDQAVRTKATFAGMKGALYEFDVCVHDEGGLAGVGRHTRALVDPVAFMRRARARFADA